MRRATFIALPALLLAYSFGAHAQTASQFSMDARAVRADTLLAEIGRQVGLTISVAPELANEVLVTRLRDVPTADALDRFAQTLKAQWTKDGTNWRLERAGDFKAALVADDQRRVVEALRKWIDSPENRNFFSTAAAGSTSEIEVPVPNQDPDEDPKNAQLRKQMSELYRKHSESSRKLWDTLRKGLDAQLIASVKFGDRVVQSSHPVGSQGALPPAALAALREYNAGATVRQQELAKLTEQTEMDFGVSMAGINRLLMIIKRSGPYSWEVRFRGLNRENQDVVTQQYAPSVMDRMALMMMFDPERGSDLSKLKLKVNNVKTPIPTTEKFKSFAVFINSITQGAPPPMLDSKEMLDFFRNPIKYDPLSQAPASALFALAEDQKAQLIAVVPDDAFVLESSAMYNRELKLGDAVAVLEQLGTAELSSNDGWVTMSSSYPTLSTRARLDRKALQELAQKDQANGALSIMDKASFWLTYPEYSEMLWQIYQYLAVPSMAEGMFEGGMGGDSNDAYRFFASLNPPDRDQLLAGQAVPLTRLTGQMRGRFIECLDDVQSLSGENTAMQNFMSIPASMGMDEDDEEPVPFADISDLPGTAYAQAFVTSTSSQDVVVKPVGDLFSIFMMQTLTAETLAMLKQMMNSQTPSGFEGMMPKLDRLRPGNRTRLDLKFAVTPKFGGRHLLSGVQMFGDRNGVPEAQLPAEFLAALRKAEELYRGAMEGEMPEEPPKSNTP